MRIECINLKAENWKLEVVSHTIQTDSTNQAESFCNQELVRLKARVVSRT